MASSVGANPDRPAGRLMSEFRGLVRPRDPSSSWDAAGQQDEAKLGRVQTTIVALFQIHGPMTDETLVERYTALESTDPDVQRASAQSVRSRRHELQVKGLVRDTGRQGRTTLGNAATIWAARETKGPEAVVAAAGPTFTTPVSKKEAENELW
jgi:hypothetical protein